jgi:transcriptional regulator with XRE-family HTH domain
MDADELRRRVTQRRRALGLSVRQAAAVTGLSNQAWGAWENPPPSKPNPKLTPRVQRAIAVALEWPDDWPDLEPDEPELPAEVVSQLDAMQALQQELAEQVHEVLVLMKGVAAEVRHLRAATESPQPTARSRQ